MTEPQPYERVVCIIKPDGKAHLHTIRIAFIEAKIKVMHEEVRQLHPVTIRELYSKSPTWIMEVGARRIASQGLDDLGYVATPEEIRHAGVGVLEEIVQYLSREPLHLLILEGEIAVMRQLLGSTEPVSAEDGTLRRLLSKDSFQKSDRDARAIQNIAHISGTLEEAMLDALVLFKGTSWQHLNYRSQDPHFV